MVIVKNAQGQFYCVKKDVCGFSDEGTPVKFADELARLWFAAYPNTVLEFVDTD